MSHKEHIIGNLKQIIIGIDSGFLRKEETGDVKGALRLYRSLLRRYQEFAKWEEIDEGYFPDLQLMGVCKYPYEAKRRLESPA